MSRPIFRIALAFLATAACAAHAQPGPPPGGVPPRAALALVPGFDAAQVKDVQRIESERRDAHDQLAIRQRGEHARIDDEADDRLRKRLGDEGWRKYLEWKLQAGGPRGMRHGGPAGAARPKGGEDVANPPPNPPRGGD